MDMLGKHITIQNHVTLSLNIQLSANQTHSPYLCMSLSKEPIIPCLIQRGLYLTLITDDAALPFC